MKKSKKKKQHRFETVTVIAPTTDVIKFVIENWDIMPKKIDYYKWKKKK